MKFIQRRRGASPIEYGVLIGLILVVFLVATQSLPAKIARESARPTPAVAASKIDCSNGTAKIKVEIAVSKDGTTTLPFGPIAEAAAACAK